MTKPSGPSACSVTSREDSLEHGLGNFMEFLVLRNFSRSIVILEQILACLVLHYNRNWDTVSDKP